jgi:23S rRNA (cytosine1962-C5)-methyltransferase
MTDVAALLNRVAKNQRHLARWARREGLEAYRLYDRDMPEFPLAIDRYANWLHVQVFEQRRPLGDEAIAGIRHGLAETLDVDPDHVAVKQRRRQRGRSQYNRLDDVGPAFTVAERDQRFEVNLVRYLDTGLFLDHRETRALVREAARDLDVLNLFAYTGSFTVYAAAGGARRTVTVDMSRTYQDWSRRNLALNRIAPGNRHHFVQDDALAFLSRTQRSGARFDLIVLDPPSFSNSKRMEDSFDVQRDHVGLLRAALGVLAPGGTLYFSNNRRGFRLDERIANEADVSEISDRTVPPDFARSRPHRCWTLRR